MKLPDRIFGKIVEGRYEEFLKRSEKEPEQSRSREIHTSLDGVNLQDYIMDEKNGIYVAKARTHQGSNWAQSHEALHNEGARMLTIREFIDFLELLKSGNAKDGLGNILSRPELQSVYKDITEKVNPWRSEWLDADFKIVRRLHINYNHRIVNGQLKPQNSEPLEECLMENGYVDLFSANRQGLPTRNSSSQDFYYWKPIEDNNSVARFYAGSGWADLSCSWDPGDSDSRLGVRAARDKANQIK